MQVVKSIISKNLIHKKNVNLMGTPFEISVVAADADWAEERVKSAVAEIKRIDKLLTTLSSNSQTNLINHSAGIAPVKINGELFRLIERSLKIAELTEGSFDITYGTELSYQKVELNAEQNTVFLKEKGMRIYFGGVAKGYAADRAKYVLQMEGVSSGVINADSNILTWGLQADGSQWTLGDADASQEMKPYANFNMGNMAIATYPKRDLDNASFDGVKSVSVMGTSAELATAMAAPLMVLGIKAGTAMIDRLQQLACVFVDADNHMFASKFMNALN
jgi:thiamine biosynthesis lipoprotein